VARGKDKASGQPFSYTEGVSLHGEWTKQNGQVSKAPLDEDDMINHLVDNWYCFCSGVKSLWRDVSVQDTYYDGKAASLVKVKDPFFGSVISFWFAKQSGLVIGREYVTKGANGPVLHQETFFDFRKVGNYTVSFQSKEKFNGSTVLETVSSFRADTGYADYIFEP